MKEGQVPGGQTRGRSNDMHSVDEAPCAILAVSDKKGVESLARALAECGWRLYGTRGTVALLREARLKASDVHIIVEAPPRFAGRVKTLNDRIFGGILFRREDPVQVREAYSLDLPRIDLVACNFYPFAQATAQEVVQEAGELDEQLIELIDIGGPAMIRAAAKNHRAVVALVDPADYEEIVALLREGDPPYGAIDARTRRRLAAKAFQATAAYDTAIAALLAESIADRSTSRV